ncbi:uncharacterized protein LOC21386937 [Morus notabilis]|uniref:uncharacterized protein LOC21386937 n=1 Tax=Morus notabilis TaxID=981085 RepID=UPI000CED312B|nr:uncharacterized protein LOC21386937 [Morus notabilis]
MEGKKAQTKTEAATRRQIAIQSKVEHLLSPLKSSANRFLNLQMEETLKKEIADLKIQLARERLNNKRVKLCGSFELLLQLVVLLFVFTFFLLLVSRSL